MTLVQITTGAELRQSGDIEKRGTLTSVYWKNRNPRDRSSHYQTSYL